MSYTVTKGQPQGYPLFDTNKIREALIAEIFAINGYTEHIANSNMEDINILFNNVIKYDEM